MTEIRKAMKARADKEMMAKQSFIEVNPDFFDLITNSNMLSKYKRTPAEPLCDRLQGQGHSGLEQELEAPIATAGRRRGDAATVDLAQLRGRFEGDHFKRFTASPVAALKPPVTRGLSSRYSCVNTDSR